MLFKLRINFNGLGAVAAVVWASFPTSSWALDQFGTSYGYGTNSYGSYGSSYGSGYGTSYGTGYGTGYGTSSYGAGSYGSYGGYGTSTIGGYGTSGLSSYGYGSNTGGYGSGVGAYGSNYSTAGLYNTNDAFSRNTALSGGLNGVNMYSSALGGTGVNAVGSSLSSYQTLYNLLATTPGPSKASPYTYGLDPNAVANQDAILGSGVNVRYSKTLNSSPAGEGGEEKYDDSGVSRTQIDNNRANDDDNDGLASLSTKTGEGTRSPVRSVSGLTAKVKQKLGFGSSTEESGGSATSAQ